MAKEGSQGRALPDTYVNRRFLIGAKFSPFAQQHVQFYDDSLERSFYFELQLNLCRLFIINR